MRDIPVFTTEFGVASLVLKQIPYQKTAYIHVQAALDLPALMKECVGFCRAAGAETVYATGHSELASYPRSCKVISMQATRQDLPETDAVAVPVEESSLERWRQIYNDKMAQVEQAAYLDTLDARKIFLQEQGYFVRREEQEIGILVAAHDRLEAVASLVPGGGRDCVLALKNLLTQPLICLQVASTNIRALELYKSLGFSPSGKETVWHEIL